MRSTIRRGAAIIALACAPPAAGAAGDGPLRIATLSYPVYLMALNVAGRAPGVEVSYIRLHSASAPAEWVCGTNTSASCLPASAAIRTLAWRT